MIEFLISLLVVLSGADSVNAVTLEHDSTIVLLMNERDAQNASVLASRYVVAGIPIEDQFALHAEGIRADGDPPNPDDMSEHDSSDEHDEISVDADEQVPASEENSGTDIPQVWLDLADCESGNWTGSTHEPGSARWDWGHDLDALPPWASIMGGERGAQFHGGLQFHPDTWNWVAPMVLDSPPQWAWQATQLEQVQVGMKTQELQGWGAWPVCAVRIGVL